MKIVYCKEKIHNNAGTERVLANKANYLINHGFEVFIITTNETRPPFFHFDERIRFFNIDFDFYSYKKEKGYWKKKQIKKRNIRIYLEKLSDILSGIKPDIMVSMFDKDTRYIYKLKNDAKKILEIHTAKYREKQLLAKIDKHTIGRIFTYPYRRRYYRLASKFDQFVVLTEEDKQLWGNLENIVAIPNFMPFVPEITSEVKEKKIIAIGRLTQQKRMDILIDIWQLVAKKYPDWQLHIYGNGELKEALTGQIKQLGIENQTILMPATKDIEKVFLDSSVLAMTSAYEGFPMVLIEAMSHGLPVVSFSYLCGPKDAITDAEDGFIIPMGNNRLFAEKLSLLIENEELRIQMGKNASGNIQRFSEENIMKKWITLFKTMTTR